MTIGLRVGNQMNETAVAGLAQGYLGQAQARQMEIGLVQEQRPSQVQYLLYFQNLMVSSR